MADYVMGCVYMCLPLIVVLLNHVTTACMDTIGCETMLQNDPNLCQTSRELMSLFCPKYCNLCGTRAAAARSTLTCFECDVTTSDPSSCTTQKNCGQGELCMLSTFHSQIDGRYAYKMNCASIAHCEGLEYLTILGKRSPNARTISTDCCDQDLCNTPSFRPTTVSPAVAETTLSPTPSPSQVASCLKDVEILTEESFRISTTEVQYVKYFLKAVINSIDVDTQAAHVGFALFDTQIHERHGLYNNNTTALNGVDALTFSHRRGTTVDINDVITFLTTGTLASDRGNVEKVAVLIFDQHAQQELVATHGMAHQHLPTIDYSPLQSLSHDVIVVNVGTSQIDSIFAKLATDPQHVLNVRDYNELITIVPSLVALICK